jgi:hypothetical protein
VQCRDICFISRHIKAFFFVNSMDHHPYKKHIIKH